MDINYPYTLPNSAVEFIEDQFRKFGVQTPSPRVLNAGGEFLIGYVLRHQYYPKFGSEEARARLESPGLTEPEKYQILGPLEYRVRADLREVADIRVLHLLAWAALLWCWSREGVNHVEWLQNVPIQDTATAACR